MEGWLENFAQANFRRSADTAHDLKTPLNVAVLNLELLRMRLRKQANGEDDEKSAEYLRAIELELRRLGKIFDAFFLLSTPPRDGEQPAEADIAALCREAAESSGIPVALDGPLPALVHPERIQQMFRLFFAGVVKAIAPETARASAESADRRLSVVVDGRLRDEALEPSKTFKFYYSDAEGNSELSLATARLIIETYGGEISAESEHGRVSFRLSLPLGEK